MTATRSHVFCQRMAGFCLWAVLLAAAAAPAGAANSGKVALVLKALSNPYCYRMEAGVRQHAEETGTDLDIFGLIRSTHVTHQIGIIENLISRGYGAIIIAPADSRQLVAVCAKAVSRGIVVVNIDNPLDPRALAAQGVEIPYVGPDKRHGAALVGAYVRQRLRGRGRVIVLDGPRGTVSAEDLRAGLLEGLKIGEGIDLAASECANWHTADAVGATTRLLQAKGPVDAVLCANDKMAMGAYLALELTGQAGKVLVTGYDNTQALRSEMQNGNIHATVEQHPDFMGRLGLDLALRRLRGERVPGRVQTPVVLVTAESFDRTVGLSVSNLDTWFFGALVEGARQRAELLGITLVMRDAAECDAAQLRDVSEMLNMRADLLVVNPVNSQTIVPAIDLANRAKVPVISLDRRCAGGRLISHIGSDNAAGGRLAADVLSRRLQGSGRIVEFEGTPGTSAAQERGEGFNQALAAHPALQVVVRETANFDRQAARQQMAALLEQGLSFEGVFAHNDEMILGVLDALAAGGGSTRPVLVGFDATPEAVQAVRDGRLGATIAQQPARMGELALEAAAAYFRGTPPAAEIAVKLEVLEAALTQTQKSLRTGAVSQSLETPPSATAPSTP
ncbi:MAG: substrate-binding domain-containing protein [Desulfobacterales bacterium]